MTTSKSFRAVLPNLGEEELQRLRMWAADNCSVSSVFREGEAVIWLASKDKARSREAFLRSVRATLRGLGVDVSRLRGRWLILADVCAVVPTSFARDVAHTAQDAPTPRRDPVPELEADGAKVISLGWSSAPKRSCVHVLKE